MADNLSSPDDLDTLLGLGGDIDEPKAVLLTECATAVIQAAVGGQRIVYVADDTGVLMGTPDQWFQLPQWPVARGDVTEVTIDGDAVTDFKQFGARLWRRCGWAPSCGEPSEVGFTYSHGYPTGSQGLQLGRAGVLSLVRGLYDNPTGATSESIDDYSVAYERMAGALEASKFLTGALRRQYGSRAGMVRLG